MYLVTEPAGLTPARVREAVGDADGILEIAPRGSAAADVVVWNPDGSQAELSGNGTRIAAAWLAERSGARDVSLTVGAREVVVRTLADGAVEQEMGVFKVGPRESVVGIAFVPVDVGNPHAVVEDDPDRIGEIGPTLESHPHFPNRTNVQVVRVEWPGTVRARVWERGVGETQASGTSAVAVAAATHSDGEVTVRFPGGDLRVRLERDRAWLTGPPATRVDESASNRHATDTPS
jgi:diaminopimelate epimerase